MNFFTLRDLVAARIFALIFGRFFRRLGKKAYVIRPLKISGMKHISIGDDVIINFNAWLAAQPLDGGACALEIGSGSQIGHFNHIFATKRIKIGAKVLTGDKVYISDNLHRYEDIHCPVLDQGVRQIEPVEIGDGSWIGENAVILGAKIGRHCVVGSNAVVTKDVPDYCVVAGAPAKVIKRYDAVKGTWEKVSE